MLSLKVCLTPLWFLAGERPYSTDWIFMNFYLNYWLQKWNLEKNMHHSTVHLILFCLLSEHDIKIKEIVESLNVLLMKNAVLSSVSCFLLKTLQT